MHHQHKHTSHHTNRPGPSARAHSYDQNGFGKNKRADGVTPCGALQLCSKKEAYGTGNTNQLATAIVSIAGNSRISNCHSADNRVIATLYSAGGVAASRR